MNRKLKFMLLKRKRFLKSEDLRDEGFCKLGENVLIHEDANIVGFDKIAIGDNVRIDPFVSIIANANVDIGSYIHIGAYTYISAQRAIQLHDFVNISQSVKIYTSNDDYSGASMTNPMVPDDCKKVKLDTLTLGRHVIIGSSSVILPGCHVEEGSAVGALSFVNYSLGSWGVYAGIPVKYIRARSKALLQYENNISEIEIQ